MSGTKKRLAVAVGVIVAVAAGVAVGVRLAQNRDASRAAPPPIARKDPPSYPVRPTRAQPSITSEAGNPAPPKPQESLSARVSTLVASGSPRDALDAFKLLDQCVIAREAQGGDEEAPRDPDKAAHRYSPEEMCGDLTPGQIASRYQLVEKAAKAKVPGAAARLAQLAPDGRPGYEVWTDPNYAAWKREALDLARAAAKRGDIEALAMMQGLYEEGGLEGRNPPEAIKYWVAFTEALRLNSPERFGKGAPGEAKFEESTAKGIARISDGLTPAQVEAAKAAGKRLIADCCANKHKRQP